MKRSFLSLLILLTTATGVWAKDWTTRYFTANGLNFERQKDNTMKLIKASQRTEYLGDLDEWGLTATNVTKTQKVGIAKYTEESYEIPAEVNGMPVTAMEPSVFSGNANIKTVTFADGQMTIIPNGAFKNCTALERLDFSGSSISQIDKEAFGGCTALVGIDDWGVVDSLGMNAFKGCTALEAVSISPSITQIVSSVFSGCTNLKTVRFEDTETPIRLANSTTSIFYNCPVEKVYLGRKLVNNNSSNFANGILFQKHTTITEFELGELIDTIPKSLFGYMASEMTVKAPNVVHVAENAFANSKNITLIAPKLKTIGKRAFQSSVLPSFTFTIEDIGTEAFYKATIDEIVITNAVKSIQKSAFSNTNTRVLRIEDGDEPIELGLDTSVDESKPEQRYNNPGWLISGSLEELYIGRPIGHDDQFVTSSNATSLQFKSTSSSTSFIPNLKTLTLTKVKALQVNSFAKCTKLTSVSMPMLEEVPKNCFVGCTSLAEDGCISLPKATVIQEAAFSGCTGLTTEAFLDAPKLETIGTYAFKDCTGLTGFTVPTNVTKLCSYAFDGCKNLKRVTLAYGETPVTMGDYGYIGEELYIDRNVANSFSIYDGYDYTNLKTIIIGSNVKDVSGFSINSPYITTVQCMNAVPLPLVATDDAGQHGALFPELYDTHYVNLGYVVQDNAKLVVPRGTVRAYRNAPVWKGFNAIVAEGEVPVAPAADYVAGQAPDGFNPVAADQNGDGVFNILDIVIIIDDLTAK
ncbi:MAG: leucine-rich repeat domain-containing protein [Prevotella sp.]|nr:leucine-rich repeat domain-containing protein [Prevotella sp.]